MRATGWRAGGGNEHEESAQEDELLFRVRVGAGKEAQEGELVCGSVETELSGRRVTGETWWRASSGTS